jgi:hypothetical protein
LGGLERILAHRSETRHSDENPRGERVSS